MNIHRFNLKPIAALILGLSSASAGFAADDMNAIRNEIQSMRSAYEARINELEQRLKSVESSSAEQKAGQTAEANKDVNPVKSTFKDGYLGWKSDDGNYELKLDGRVQLDTGTVDSDKNDLQSDTNFRRVRLGLKSKLWETWEGEMDLDFANNDAEIKDMWLAYNGFQNSQIKIGNFKPHFSIDQVTSSRVATYLESSIATETVAPSRRIGLAGSHWQDSFFIGGGIFGDKVNNNEEFDDNNKKDDPNEAEEAERYGYSTRAVFLPYYNATTNNVFHVGLNYLNQKPRTNEGPKDSRLKFAGVLENELDGIEFVDTGNMSSVDDSVTTGLELVGKMGPHIFQSEYLKTEVSFTDSGFTSRPSDVEFDGYYLAYSFFIQGDRSYSPTDAEFGRITTDDALELTLRFSSVDYDDLSGGTNDKPDTEEPSAPEIGITGGEADITTIGLNWYPNKNLMFRLNYIRADTNKNANADEGTISDQDILGDDSIDIIGLRTQFTF